MRFARQVLTPKAYRTGVCLFYENLDDEGELVWKAKLEVEQVGACELKPGLCPPCHMNTPQF